MGRFNRKLGPFWTGAVFDWGRFDWQPCLHSSYLVRLGQSIPNPREDGRLMFPCSVFFKLANVIDYDRFFLPMYSVRKLLGHIENWCQTL